MDNFNSFTISPSLPSYALSLPHALSLKPSPFSPYLSPSLSLFPSLSLLHVHLCLTHSHAIPSSLSPYALSLMLHFFLSTIMLPLSLPPRILSPSLPIPTSLSVSLSLFIFMPSLPLILCVNEKTNVSPPLPSPSIDSVQC